MKTFEDFKKDINLAEFACSQYGYALNKRSSTKSALVLQQQGHDGHVHETIVVRVGEGGKYYYTNPNNALDKGSIIDFVKSRAENSDVKTINEVLHRYDGTAYEIPETKIQQSPLKDHQKNAVEFFSLKPLTDRSYLHSRGISDITLDSPEFVKRVFSKEVKHDSGSYVNTAFPLYNQAGFSGVEMKNFKFNRGSAEGSDKRNSLWISYFDKTQKVDKIIIGEAAIDLLSYHELHHNKNERVIYVATNGSLTDPQTSLIQTLVAQQKPSQVVLACDNDISGHFYNINLAGKISVAEKDYKGVELLTSTNKLSFHAIPVNYKVHLKIDLGFENKNEGIKLAQQVKEEFLKLSVQKDNKFDVLVKEIGENKGVVEVVFDKTVQNLEQVQKKIPKLRELDSFFYIKQPILKDFNDDLVAKKNLDQAKSKQYQEKLKGSSVEAIRDKKINQLEK